MNKRQAAISKAAPLACVLLLASCGTAPDGASRLGYSDEVYNASNRIVSLQSLHAQDTQPMGEMLETVLASDVVTLRARMEPSSVAALDEAQRASALRTLVITAILNEKYEVEAWRADQEMQAGLSWALQHNPELTKQIRAREWRKSLWRNK